MANGASASAKASWEVSSRYYPAPLTFSSRSSETCLGAALLRNLTRAGVASLPTSQFAREMLLRLVCSRSTSKILLSLRSSIEGSLMTIFLISIGWDCSLARKVSILIKAVNLTSPALWSEIRPVCLSSTADDLVKLPSLILSVYPLTSPNRLGSGKMQFSSHFTNQFMRSCSSVRHLSCGWLATRLAFW